MIKHMQNCEGWYCFGTGCRSVFYDKAGNIVLEYNDKQFGNKTRYKMKNSEYLLLTDEVGSNTNGDKDKTQHKRRLCHEDDSAVNNPLLRG